MNIFLIGNGFDLAHFLPTKYENFLHTIAFLIKNYTNDMTTVGSILGNPQLCKADWWISKCYDRYRAGWDQSPLHSEEINAIINKAKKNVWFTYFLESFDQDLGWIDFEKEISYIINSFSDFFAHNNERTFAMELEIEKEGTRYVISRFSYFHEHIVPSPSLPSPYENRRVRDKYCTEYPKGSGIWVINKEAVIDELYAALGELSFLLKEYLRIFVEQPINTLMHEKLLLPNPQFQKEGRVITFNYSSVFEKVYGAKDVIHIHGALADKIVLGVNPNEDDDLHTVDTTFLQFKKYYQRVRFGTDISYLNFMEYAHMAKRYDNGHTVTVVGHSLDVTDKDIIMEVFSLPNAIIILYHDEKAIGNYIKNLVNIYGKEGFDRLRFEKKLRFMPLSS